MPAYLTIKQAIQIEIHQFESIMDNALPFRNFTYFCRFARVVARNHLNTFIACSSCPFYCKYGLCTAHPDYLAIRNRTISHSNKRANTILNMLKSLL